MEIYRLKFGKLLGTLLEQRGMKQYELAGLIGIEAPNVSRWVKGVNFPDEEHFKKLCKVLGVAPAHFLDEPAPLKSELILAITDAIRGLDQEELGSLLNIARGYAQAPAAASTSKPSKILKKS